jgi:hypothetical protein
MMRRDWGWLGSAAVGSGLYLSGCYTTATVAKIDPLPTRYPVSASPQYVDEQDRIVTERDYQVVRSFAFERVVEAPRHESTQSKLDLAPRLNAIMQSSGGDAVTNLKIEPTAYDHRSHAASSVLKSMGWIFGTVGAMTLVMGLARDDENSQDFKLLGGIFTGIGVAVT